MPDNAAHLSGQLTYNLPLQAQFHRIVGLHPVHLHRNSFELTNVYGKPTSGVMKDVVLVKGFRKIAVDVTPAMDGLTLFHCHQQLHMDYGFMSLFDYA